MKCYNLNPVSLAGYIAIDERSRTAIACGKDEECVRLVYNLFHNKNYAELKPFTIKTITSFDTKKIRIFINIVELTFTGSNILD